MRLTKVCAAETRMETYQIEPNQPTHGYSGPLKVSWGGMMTNFLDVAKAIDKDRGMNEDVKNLLFDVNKYVVRSFFSGAYPSQFDMDTV